MSIVWSNGRFVESLNLDPAERGLMLGDGIFETLAVRDGKAIWLEAHLARMENAAHELGLSFNASDIRFAITATLKRSAQPSEVLRVTLTRGPTARGLAVDGTKPTLVLSLNPFDRSKLPASVRLATSAIRRNAAAPSSQFKTLSYIDAIAAAREVSDRADDALMLNTEENVASTTIANIFLLKGNSLITPAEDQAILPGIARNKLITGAPELGLDVESRLVKIDELLAAEAVFVTNSLRLATTVSSIDGTACGMRSILPINTFLERSLT
jgi:branched-chain amino acid aminotransferase